MEFELAYKYFTVQQVSHYATRTFANVLLKSNIKF